MRTVIVNSRGQVAPTRVRKGQPDQMVIAFDFSLFMPQVDSYSVTGDMPIIGHSRKGSRVTVTTDTAQACRTYDLIVTATGNGERRAATIQVEVEDRRQGWNALGCGGYW